MVTVGIPARTERLIVSKLCAIPHTKKVVDGQPVSACLNIVMSSFVEGLTRLEGVGVGQMGEVAATNMFLPC